MASNFLYDFLSAFKESFTGGMKEHRQEERETRRYQRYGEALTRHKKQTLAGYQAYW